MLHRQDQRTDIYIALMSYLLLVIGCCSVISTGYGSNAQGKINVFALEITTDADYENYPPIAFDQSSYVKAGEEPIIPLRAIDPEGRSFKLSAKTVPSAGLLEIFSAKKLGAYEEKDSFGEGISVDLVLANSEELCL